jgi:hypothetical protein
MDHVLPTRFPRYWIATPGHYARWITVFSMLCMEPRCCEVDGKWGTGIFAIVWKISMGRNATRLFFGMNYCVEIDEAVRFCCKWTKAYSWERCQFFALFFVQFVNASMMRECGLITTLPVVRYRCLLAWTVLQLLEQLTSWNFVEHELKTFSKTEIILKTICW